MKQWYEEFFENASRNYDSESFTRGTVGECDFIEQEIKSKKSCRILDVGCGTGRHAIELARRGYDITGVDLSPSQIRRAREKAQVAGLAIRFEEMDARNMPFDKEFDLVIMLCEGGFPLMETDEMNFLILENAAKALKRPGKFIFTTLNGLFPLLHSIRDFHNESTEEGGATYDNHSFDIMTFRDHNITRREDDDGNKQSFVCNERYYIPPEITWLLKTLGFNTIDIYGARLGAFSRKHKLTTEDFEMLVVAEKC
ncbi:MAG: class I SAM-dependent methyltransferase [Bacteroidales bacterium]|nr:class I SAM-dependent methyltransferase [Bacteroidales bacterium]